MEMKTYKRYTKANLEEDMVNYRDIKVKTVTGRATYVSSRDGRLSMKLNGSTCWLKHDDVIKKAAEHLTGRDQIEISYFRDIWDNTTKVISFVNHTKSVTVVNQRFVTLINELDKIKAEHSKHHEFLAQYTDLSKDHLILLTKKQEDGEQLVDIANARMDVFTYPDNARGTAEKVLTRNGIQISAGNWFDMAAYYGKIEIPENEKYYLYVVRVSDKRNTCSCGASPYDVNMPNHSIIFGQKYIKRYMCEYCFMEEMRIHIPENFFESMKGNKSNV